MKRGKTIFSIFLLLALISFATASTTPIAVKTLPFHEVQLTTYDTDSSSFIVLERFTGISDRYGDAYFNFTSDKSKFNIIIFIKDLNGNKIIDDKYPEEYSAGEPVSIQLAPSEFEFIETPKVETVSLEPETTNVTETIETNNTSSINENSTISPEEEKESPLKIIGYAINKSGVSSTTIYYAAGIILAIILLWILLKLKKKSKKSADKKESNDSSSKELKEAEEKLKKVQEEINQIKNKDKIAEAKRKLIEDEKELMRLRKGE